MLPEEPANSRRASGIQAHVKAGGKRLLLRAAPEPLGLEPSAWARTGGTSPKPRLGSGGHAVWKKSGPVLPRRAGEGGYKRFSAYCKRIVRRLRGGGIHRIPAAAQAASCTGKMVARPGICKAQAAHLAMRIELKRAAAPLRSDRQIALRHPDNLPNMDVAPPAPNPLFTIRRA